MSEQSSLPVDPAFLALVGDIYEGPLQEQPWQTFLPRVRAYFDADIAAIFLQPPAPGSQMMMLVDGGLAEGITNYERGQFVLDPFVDLPEGEVVTLHEVIATDELLTSDFYRLIMKPYGLYDFIGMDMRVPGEFEARFRLSRYEGRERFGARDKALCAALLEHIQRAIRIHARLNRIESERDLYAGAVQRLAVGTIILDEEGRIIDTNPMAARMLDIKDGIRAIDGKLRLGSREANAELQRVIEQVLANQRRAVPSTVAVIRVPRPGGAADLGLVVRAAPTSRWTEGKAVPAVAIFVSDPEQEGGADTETLQRLFGFTQAEARLSLLLANGFTLDEAAQTLGVSRNTVRTHLRSIFGKTGVSRQTMLVRLILKSAAPLGTDYDEPGGTGQHTNG